jgi:hypothetical protein
MTTRRLPPEYHDYAESAEWRAIDREGQLAETEPKPPKLDGPFVRELRRILLGQEKDEKAQADTALILDPDVINAADPELNAHA